MEALDEVENTWVNASRCANLLGELAGLVDIKLESEKFVYKKDSKPSPPLSITIPNSSEPSSSKLSEPSSPFSQAPQSMDIDKNHTFDDKNYHHARSLSMPDYLQKQQQQQLQYYQPTKRASTDSDSYQPFSYSPTSINTTSQFPHSLLLPSFQEQQNQILSTASPFKTSPSFLNETTATMESFYAPGITSGLQPLPEEFDLLGSAFLGYACLFESR